MELVELLEQVLNLLIHKELGEVEVPSTRANRTSHSTAHGHRQLEKGWRTRLITMLMFRMLISLPESNLLPKPSIVLIAGGNVQLDKTLPGTLNTPRLQ